MLLSFLILHADPARLRLAGALGFSIGLTAFLLALNRPRTNSTSLSPEPISENPSSDSPALHDSSLQEASAPQVIRLSLPSISSRSTEMTQQQKVAAALLRAGIANPAAWTDSSADRTGENSTSTSTAIAEPLALPASQTSAPQSQPQNQPGLTWGRKLLLFAGLSLALVSLYVFLRIR